MLKRDDHSLTVTIPSGGALSEAINIKSYALGLLHMPSAWTAADIGFQVSSTVGGTYLPLNNEDGGLLVVSGPLVDQAYVIPARVGAALYVKLWSNTGGTGENQAAARSIIVDLKA
jgi:hypothetical protein